MLEYTSDLSTIGGRMRYYRLLNGLSQEELSHKSGIDRTTIIRYENNQLNHSLELCYKIAKTIGIDPNFIYDEYLAFISSSFGNKIKNIRKKNKLTQHAFGAIIGVHRKTITRWEKEQLSPTRENYLSICKFM